MTKSWLLTKLPSRDKFCITTSVTWAKVTMVCLCGPCSRLGTGGCSMIRKNLKKLTFHGLNAENMPLWIQLNVNLLKKQMLITLLEEKSVALVSWAKRRFKKMAMSNKYLQLNWNRIRLRCTAKLKTITIWPTKKPCSSTCETITKRWVSSHSMHYL
jgi:hypothetical protein